MNTIIMLDIDNTLSAGHRISIQQYSDDITYYFGRIYISRKIVIFIIQYNTLVDKQKFNYFISFRYSNMNPWICMILFLFQIQCLKDLSILKAQMEKKITGLHDKVLQQFSNFNGLCSPSFFQCNGTSQLICYTDFQKPEGCVSQGINFSEKSAIRFSKNIDDNPLSNLQKHVICSSQRVEPYFQSISDNRNGEHSKAYFGTSTGFFRSHPTIKYEPYSSCIQYDPRFRPWYTSAITGTKNLVMIIDFSNALQNQLAAIKIASTNIVKTLVEKDSVAIIGLTEQVIAFNESVVKMNEKARNDSINKIQSFTTSGKSNLTAGFEKAFNLLSKANNNESLCCRQYRQGSQNDKTHVVFVFLTDGRSDQSDNVDTLINYINSFADFQVQMFPISFSKQKSHHDFMKKLSCQYSGTYIQLEHNYNSLTINLELQKIYSLMGKSKLFEKPTWSQLYNDVFYFGKMVTVAKPVYYTNNKLHQLIGVVGIDIPISQYETEAQNFTRLLSNDNQYHINNDTCFYQSFRSSDMKCASECNQTAQSVSSIEQLLSSTAYSSIESKSLFQPPQTQNTSKCCGLNAGQLSGIIVGAVLALAAIIVFISVYLWKRGKKGKNYQEKDSKDKDKEKEKEVQERQKKQKQNQNEGANSPWDHQIWLPKPPKQIFEI